MNSANMPLFIPANVFVLDGGIGSMLEDFGYSVNKSEIWSGGALIDAPELLEKTHKKFIEAGADIIETNTYHVCLQKVMETRGYSQEQAESLIHKAVQIARDCISASDRPVALVGSIGPYATYLRDASEYSGEYVKKADFREQMIIDYYLAQSRPLLASGVSTLVFETIPSLKEVECVAKVLDKLGTDVLAWVCSTCQDGKRTRSGDAFVEVVKVANKHPKIVAIGVNCTAPEHITGLLEEANKAGNAKALVVYPNSGEVYNAETRKFEGPTHIDVISASIPRWYALGARIFGGCCRITPAHIAQIAAACRTLGKRKAEERRGDNCG